MRQLPLLSLLGIATLAIVLGLSPETSAQQTTDDFPAGLTETQKATWAKATDQQKARWTARMEARQRSEARRSNSAARREPPAPRNNNFGTIRYDPDAGSPVFLGNGGSAENAMGNVFNTASGSPLKASGSVTGVSVFGRGPTTSPQRGGSFGAGVSFFQPPNPTGSAVTIGYTGLGQIPVSSFQFVTLGTPVAVSGTFLAALYQGGFTPADYDSIGLKTGSHNGQGFHAFQINFASGTGTGYSAIAGHNAMIRTTGNIILPVELMSFSIE